MISLHKLHSHVHHKEIYLYKRFQKFSIKTLTKNKCRNFKNKQKIGLSTLGVNIAQATLEEICMRKLEITKNNTTAQWEEMSNNIGSDFEQ